MHPLNTWYIHIKGQVRGVGFRPFVYLLATKHRLKGWVNNANDGVHIQFNAEATQAEQFFNAIHQEAPRLAHIAQSEMCAIDQQGFSDFSIVHSHQKGERSLLLSPDFALCPSCRQDIHQINNHRYQYAFTTCTLCGPRFSIITQLPYDRPYTSMQPYTMCASCQSEYDNSKDRRYYSQTNSSKECGIQLALYNRGRALVSTDQEAIEYSQNSLQWGVFQNGLLVDLILHHYKNKYELYFHKQLSPNDENISFGQLMLTKFSDYVFSNSGKSTIHSGAV